MRREQLEIGIEREYALLASIDDAVSYLLANDRFLDIFERTVPLAWSGMRANGWRLAAEYSRCLVELSSPPVGADQWPELLAGFALVEEWLRHTATLLWATSKSERRHRRFERLSCTAEFSLRTDRYITWDCDVVTRFSDLLLDPTDVNRLVGATQPPECLGDAHLAYAGFTSTNATVHPPLPDEDDEEQLASYFWRLLSVARQIELTHPQSHTFLHEGRISIPPDPERTIRDALIRWGEVDTAALLDGLSPDWGLAEFRALFGRSPNASFATPQRPYSCRPRVVDNTMLFELRCFHSGLPLERLAPLLEVAL